MDHPTSLESNRVVRWRTRPARLAAALLLAAALFPGCSSLYWGIKKSLRDPGERLKDFPEEVWKEYGCESRKLPFVQIEKNEVMPRHVRAGSEFNHRLVYALCPRVPTETLIGILATRILYRGRPIVREIAPAFEVKPGRWVVDTFIEVPDQAEVGIYALEVEFKSRNFRFEKRLTFAVRGSAAVSPKRTRTVHP